MVDVNANSVAKGIDRAEQIACIRTHMVRIWERWTDGNEAPGLWLEAATTDPVQDGDGFRHMATETNHLMSSLQLRITRMHRAAGMDCPARLSNVLPTTSSGPEHASSVLGH
jgi:hypothetical protein